MLSWASVILKAGFNAGGISSAETEIQVASELPCCENESEKSEN